jgi:hypothetical protein
LSFFILSGLGWVNGKSWPIVRTHVGFRLVWEMFWSFPVWWQRGFRCVFLTEQTRGHLFVPDTNPLWGPSSWFVDGDYPGNLTLGQVIGDEEVLRGKFWVGCGWFFWTGRGGQEKSSGHVQYGISRYQKTHT